MLNLGAHGSWPRALQKTEDASFFISAFRRSSAETTTPFCNSQFASHAFWNWRLPFGFSFLATRGWKETVRSQGAEGGSENYYNLEFRSNSSRPVVCGSCSLSEQDYRGRRMMVLPLERRRKKKRRTLRQQQIHVETKS